MSAIECSISNWPVIRADLIAKHGADLVEEWVCLVPLDDESARIEVISAPDDSPAKADLKAIQATLAAMDMEADELVTRREAMEEDAQRRLAVQSVEDFTSQLREQLSGGADPRAIAAWPDKASIAQRVLDDAASLDDVRGLEAETAARGLDETIEDLARQQIAMAHWYRKAVGLLDGTQARLTKAIATAPVAEIDNLIETQKAAVMAAVMDHLKDRPS
ncbi:MAG: hypothetical protein OXR62_10825 [Ahrensia sp.]|nr:hypothetical protein [Ahrensia sp.]